MAIVIVEGVVGGWVRCTAMRPPRARILDGVRLLGTSRLPPATIFPDAQTDAVQVSALGRRYLISRSPRHVEQAFVEGYDSFEKATHYRLLATVTGNGLLTSEGPEWERQRRLIQPVLGRRQLESLVPAMVGATADYLERFQPTDPPSLVDVSAEMTEVTLDVVGRALFGTDLSTFVEKLRPAVSDGMSIALTAARLQLLLGFTKRMIDFGGRIIRRVPLPPPLNRIRRVMTTIDEIVWQLIDDREDSGSGEGDLLDLLLSISDQDGTPMDRNQIRDELVTMMLAGHETTANALSWLWYLLAQHPDAWQQHRDEVEAVLSGRDPQLADLEALTWTRACVQEAMRLYPPAWVLERAARHDTSLDGGYAIRRKTTIIFPVHLIHRDARWWDEPGAFRPERFLPGAPTPPRGTYLPFGAGRRICVASNFALTEATLIAAMITQRYRFTLPEGHDVAESATVTLRPHGGLPMHVHPTS